METQHWKNKSNKIAHRRAFVCSDVSVEFPMNVRIWVLLNVMQSSNMYVFTTTIRVYVQQVAVSSQRIVLQANWCTQNPEKLKKKRCQTSKVIWITYRPGPPFRIHCNKNALLYSFIRSFIEMKDASEHTMGAFSVDDCNVFECYKFNSDDNDRKQNTKGGLFTTKYWESNLFCAAFSCVSNTWTPLKALRLSTLLQAKHLWALSWTWQGIRELTKCV